MKNDRRPVAVVGAGAWGTALAIHLASTGAAVRLWCLEHDLAQMIRDRSENPVYLPGVTIPEQVTVTTSLEEAVSAVELVLAVVPTQHCRSVLEKAAPFIAAESTVILANKGVEQETLELPLTLAAEALGPDRSLGVLSGPTFAGEVARGQPAALVIASEDETLALGAQEIVSSPRLRVYTNSDPVGVQVAAALKNVIAIAAGAADGLGLGSNARAALITRGLAEITRLGVGLGGRPETFSGLAGFGDLVLTCTGDSSRNRTVGKELGKGRLLKDILAGTRAIAEGVATTRSARALALQVGIEAPIVNEVHKILFENGSPREALRRLMDRPLTSEETNNKNGVD
jgi:glycerol-3-phosphate dehydrogenase (NAD(P)+)